MEKTPRAAGFNPLLTLRVSVPDRACALHLSHDLGDEIVLLLLDAGADLEALEREHPCACALQQLLDRLVGVLDESLAREGDLAERLAQPPLDHLRHDLRRLAFALRLAGED